MKRTNCAIGLYLSEQIMCRTASRTGTALLTEDAARTFVRTSYALCNSPSSPASTRPGVEGCHLQAFAGNIHAEEAENEVGLRQIYVKGLGRAHEFQQSSAASALKPLGRVRDSCERQRMLAYHINGCTLFNPLNSLGMLVSRYLRECGPVGWRNEIGC
jgi:hypothetical protein